MSTISGIELKYISYGRIRPAIFQLHRFRILTPYLPSAIRKLVCRLIPNENMKTYISIVDTMDEQSRRIYYDKKAALEKGDESVIQQMSEGKDIMSILSTYYIHISRQVADSVLVKANLEASEEDKLPEDELIGQMSYVPFPCHSQAVRAHLSYKHPCVCCHRYHFERLVTHFPINFRQSRCTRQDAC